MYHERREDGEKVRFAVKKRPEEGEQKKEEKKEENSQTPTEGEK
jgi:hypothetical protein